MRGDKGRAWQTFSTTVNQKEESFVGGNEEVRRKLNQNSNTRSKDQNVVRLCSETNTVRLSPERWPSQKTPTRRKIRSPLGKMQGRCRSCILGCQGCASCRGCSILTKRRFFAWILTRKNPFLFEADIRSWTQLEQVGISFERDQELDILGLDHVLVELDHEVLEEFDCGRSGPGDHQRD